MNEVILLKVGELVLKGLNRYKFEDSLKSNVRRALRPFGKTTVTLSQSTVFIELNDENADIDGALAACAKVFGIATLTKAKKCSADFDAMCKEASEYLVDEIAGARTFKVKAKRTDKNYPLSSPQIAAKLGEYIYEANQPRLQVDLDKPELTVYAELREGYFYVHADPIKGAGGLPTGTGGHGMLMLSGGIDSPVAGYMMARRGMKISAIHFESPPYTGERAKQKVLTLARIVSEYAGQIDLYVVPFTKIQEEIRRCCNEELFTVIMRRFMLRIACAVAEKCGAGAVITGESLGQVASQTLPAIGCTDAVATMPVFRPLIGTDKMEIVELSRRIGAYETSILPYEDCCTVFTPKHPRVNPRIAAVEREEQRLDIPGLLDGIVDRTELIRL